MWRKLSCNFLELNLDITLGGGQSFRWKKLNSGDWIGMVHDAVFSLKQDEDGNLLYFLHNQIGNTVDSKNSLLTDFDEISCPSEVKKKKYSHNKNSTDTLDNAPLKKLKRKSRKQNIISQNILETPAKEESILEDYLNLSLKLETYYKLWSENDENFKNLCHQYRGIRILRQNPIENLFSFICSANNNIPRITSMVEKLCSNYGQKVLKIEDKIFYTFPSIASLAQDGVEMKLRELGFGYRAKYISQTAKALHETKPKNWLENLRNVSYREAHEALLALPGVGAKVADCVCLMSLDKYNAIPVDTHIWQVTVKDYMPQLKDAKVLNKKIYIQIGDFYRERFGEYAGWANTVLFAADLKMFQKKE